MVIFINCLESPRLLCRFGSKQQCNAGATPPGKYFKLPTGVRPCWRLHDTVKNRKFKTILKKPLNALWVLQREFLTLDLCCDRSHAIRFSKYMGSVCGLFLECQNGFTFERYIKPFFENASS